MRTGQLALHTNELSPVVFTTFFEPVRRHKPGQVIGRVRHNCL